MNTIKPRNSTLRGALRIAQTLEGGEDTGATQARRRLREMARERIVWDGREEEKLRFSINEFLAGR